MGYPIKKKDKKYTYADYLTWPDDERWEIIDGVAYRMIFEMSASPASEHQDVLLELAYQIKSYLKNKPCKVLIAPFDVRLPKQNEKDEDVETVVQPDIIVVCDRTKIDARGYRGSPSLIIEILSPSTAQRDMVEKLNLYEKSGVEEYWVVHPVDKTAMVFKIGENGKYGRPETYAEEDQVKVGIFDDLVVDLKTVFGM